MLKILSKFLFTTLPTNDLGLLTRSLPIARKLIERGHEVAFSCPAKAPNALIREAGFKNLKPKHPLYHFELDDINLKGLIRLSKSSSLKNEYGNIFNFFFQLIKAIPLRFASFTPEVWNMDHAGAMIGMMNTNFVEANCIAIMKLIMEFEPEVIVDFWNPFACIAARILDKPLVSVIQVDAHPANKGFIWWKEPPKKIPSAVPAINKVLSTYALQPITKMEDLHLGDLTLIVGTPETDPLPNKSSGTYIGPILWQKNDAELPDWIEKFEDDKPIIWVYPGNPRYSPIRTVLDSEIILSACIEALMEEDSHIVLTTGHHSIPKKFLPLPKNFHFTSYVPGLRLAQKCDLLIHHGGYGSCQTGLYTGTPAVIIPTFSERESNARRIASLGAGEYVLPKTDKFKKKQISIEEFKVKVKQVLTTATYVENAERYSEKLRSYGGIEYAAQLIENFVRESVLRD